MTKRRVGLFQGFKLEHVWSDQVQDKMGIWYQVQDKTGIWYQVQDKTGIWYQARIKPGIFQHKTKASQLHNIFWVNFVSSSFQ